MTVLKIQSTVPPIGTTRQRTIEHVSLLMLYLKRTNAL